MSASVTTVNVRVGVTRDRQVHLVKKTEKGYGDIVCGLDRHNRGFAIGGPDLRDTHWSYAACLACSTQNTATMTGCESLEQLIADGKVTS